MHVVVGCRECGALWVLEGRPDTTQCPRCRTRHQFDRLKKLAEHEDADAARAVRSRLLADRAGHDAELPADEAAMAAGIDEDDYLDAAGVDADAAQAAGERAERRPRTRSRREVVLDALRDLDAPTADDVVDHAREAGVDADYAREALERLARRGEVTESDGVYRLL